MGLSSLDDGSVSVGVAGSLAVLALAGRSRVVDAAAGCGRRLRDHPLPLDLRQPPSFTADALPLDLSVLQRLAARVAKQTPAAGTAAVAEHRGGLFTMSPDGRFVA